MPNPDPRLGPQARISVAGLGSPTQKSDLPTLNSSPRLGPRARISKRGLRTPHPSSPHPDRAPRLPDPEAPTPGAELRSQARVPGSDPGSPRAPHPDRTPRVPDPGAQGGLRIPSPDPRLGPRRKPTTWTHDPDSEPRRDPGAARRAGRSGQAGAEGGSPTPADPRRRPRGAHLAARPSSVPAAPSVRLQRGGAVRRGGREARGPRRVDPGAWTRSADQAACRVADADDLRGGCGGARPRSTWRPPRR